MLTPSLRQAYYRVDSTNHVDVLGVVREALKHPGWEVHVNGMRLAAGDESTFKLVWSDEVVIAAPVEPNIVDELASLAPPAQSPAPATERVVIEPPDPYIIVPCVDEHHRRVNDLLVPDPKCSTCLGLGICRVMREHVPVVHRRGDKWVRGDDAVSRLADLGGHP